MMPSTYAKKTTPKPTLTRKSTRGPLDGEVDPLAKSSTSPLVASILEQSAEIATEADEAETIAIASTSHEPRIEKDLSFILDSAIYHPLGQVDVPPSFRKPFPAPPQPNATIEEVFDSIEALLAECNFLGAAHLSALVLTSSIVSPVAHQTIFRLLAVRYSSLELSGNTLLAAQESKALEDLTSAFYYYEPLSKEKASDVSSDEKQLAAHIMPFDLRLQAIRLQSIGFSDARRGVSALYDLGMECREYLSSSSTPSVALSVWEERLEEVGIHVVNALIETGDLDCARRTLSTMSFKDRDKNNALFARRILLALKMGNTDHAQHLLGAAKLDDEEKLTLSSLLDIAAGRYLEAREKLTVVSGRGGNVALQTIARQNMAVTQLYAGDLSDCRLLFEDLVDTQHSFQTMTMNLATVYELSSDHARDLKSKLIERVAQNPNSLPMRAYVNADFKL